MHFLHTGPADSTRVLVLAHGAGGAMDTPFMNVFAQLMADRGVQTVRFEFPYMAARRTGAKKSGAPDRQPVLLDSWREVVASLGGGEKLFIGGKSMGGRIASMVADELEVRGLVCLGYPFHPPGKPEATRTAHLAAMKTKALIIQGERDAFGTPEDVATYELSRKIRVEWLPGGDHSFKPRPKSGVTERQNLERAADLTSAFMA